MLALQLRQDPALVFELRFQDGFADLVKDGIDLAVRAGELRDSSLVGMRNTSALCPARSSSRAGVP